MWLFIRDVYHKYINDKNINHIQLIKHLIKKITDPKERERVKKEINNPHILTGMDRLRAFYGMMNLEFDDEFFNNILDEFPISE